MNNKQAIAIALIAIVNLSSCSTRKPEQPVATRTVSTQESKVNNAPYGKVVEFEDMVKKHGSEQAALDVILKSGMAIIDFYAVWCGPCQKLAPNYSSAAQEVPDVLFVKVDAEKFGTLRQQFHVRSFPTLIFLLKGEKVDSLSGLRSQKALIDETQKIFKLQ